MAKAVSVEMGLQVPEFIANKDVYDGLDEAAKFLEKKHIDVTDMAVYGLEPTCQHTFNASEFTCDTCGIDIKET